MVLNSIFLSFTKINSGWPVTPIENILTVLFVCDWCSLGLLVKRVAEVRVGEMLDVLCEKLVNGKKEAQRDIASIALKTSIAEISGGALAHVVVKVVTPKMLQGISSKKVMPLPCRTGIVDSIRQWPL